MSVSTHVLFFASFTLTTIFLFTLSNYIKHKLGEAGYELGDLILYGLPRSSEPRVPYTSHTMAAVPPFLQDLGITPQMLAIVFTLASGAVIYYAFSASSTRFLHSSSVFPS
jgi:hypothetical protein